MFNQLFLILRLPLRERGSGNTKNIGSVIEVDKNKIYSAFDRLFEKFRDSILVVSYRADGIPSVEELENLLKKYKPSREEIKRENYKYVLSNNYSDDWEIKQLLVLNRKIAIKTLAILQKEMIS